MAHDVVETSVITGETITRDYTQAEKDAIADAQAEAKKNFDALDYKDKRLYFSIVSRFIPERCSKVIVTCDRSKT